jgi:SAM-dependent methyltransferase
MQHSRPDFSQRAQLTELMDEPCSREVLRACLRDIARANRWTLAYRPLFWWLNEMAPALLHFDEPLHILDVGCGYGDGLRRVEKWAKARELAVELTGLDLNPHATVIAAEASPASSSIRWVTGDILAYSPAKRPHLVVSSLFAHHLTNEQIVQFLRWLEEHAQLGWFINDLSRAPIPYHAFRAFSKAMRLHHFVQYDGPLSVARAFVRSEWESMCATAGLGEDAVRIRAFKPARLCVARRKTQ